MTKKELMDILKKLDKEHDKLIVMEEVIGDVLLELEKLVHDMPQDKPAPRKRV